MLDFYAEAARSFQDGLDRIEKNGRKDSPDWYLVNGLLRLAQGLQHNHEAEEDQRRSFARTSPAAKPGAARC